MDTGDVEAGTPGHPGHRAPASPAQAGQETGQVDIVCRLYLDISIVCIREVRALPRGPGTDLLHHTSIVRAIKRAPWGDAEVDNCS